MYGRSRRHFLFLELLAPFGMGVLYASEQLLTPPLPFLYGGDMIAAGRLPTAPRWPDHALGPNPLASCRLSFYLYNTPGDVDRTVQAVAAIAAARGVAGSRFRP